jgi:hypothetical protein
MASSVLLIKSYEMLMLTVPEIGAGYLPPQTQLTADRSTNITIDAPDIIG